MSLTRSGPSVPCMAPERRALLSARLNAGSTSCQPQPVQPARGPAVVVGRRAADVDHRVQRAAAAGHAALRHEHLAAVGVRLRCRLVDPRALGADHAHEGRRHPDELDGVGRPGLEQQHAVPRLHEPVRDDAAGRSGADDDVVETLLVQALVSGVSVAGRKGSRLVFSWSRRFGAEPWFNPPIALSVNTECTFGAAGGRRRHAGAAVATASGETSTLIWRLSAISASNPCGTASSSAIVRVTMANGSISPRAVHSISVG